MNPQVIVKVKDYLAQRAIFVVLILLVIGIAVADPNFLAFSTLRDILQQSSTINHCVRCGLHSYYRGGGFIRWTCGWSDRGRVGFHAAD
ncbi:galactose/methyl galactoside ABC transport system, permease protein MglC [Paenibacillus sp. JCM 10914]|nr:galactose/methyl galactoside ABC transport system, permease protein MglC [Paenibacillus sp. JCM 10914]